MSSGSASATRADRVELVEAPYTCPSCWEEVTLLLDPSGGAEQQLVEDCEVCCRPLRFTVRFDGEGGLSSLRVDPSG